MADVDNVLPFAKWLGNLSVTHGCVVARQHERIYVANVGSHATGLFFCLNATTETAWMCRGDQLGRWFGAADPVRPCESSRRMSKPGQADCEPCRKREKPSDKVPPLLAQFTSRI